MSDAIDNPEAEEDDPLEETAEIPRLGAGRPVSGSAGGRNGFGGGDGSSGSGGYEGGGAGGGEGDESDDGIEPIDLGEFPDAAAFDATAESGSLPKRRPSGTLHRPGDSETGSSTRMYRKGSFVFEHLRTHAPAMANVLRLAKGAAGTHLSILITGESGTGKNLLAQAIHNASPRKDGPFVTVNASALSEHLLESELFGHERGAFTGADKLRRGHFETAKGGTLVLDEIGDMSLTAQPKILHAVEYKQFQRVGGEQLLTTDVRIIAITNCNLDQLAASQRFRPDLLYRLREIVIETPPLRARREDIPHLCDLLLRECRSKLEIPVRGLSHRAMEALSRYDWPGNIRELRSVLHRAALLAGGNRIEEEHLGLLDAQTAHAVQAPYGGPAPGPAPNPAPGPAPSPSTHYQPYPQPHAHGQVAPQDAGARPSLGAGYGGGYGGGEAGGGGLAPRGAYPGPHALAPGAGQPGGQPQHQPQAYSQQPPTAAIPAVPGHVAPPPAHPDASRSHAADPSDSGSWDPSESSYANLDLFNLEETQTGITPLPRNAMGEFSEQAQAEEDLTLAAAEKRHVLRVLQIAGGSKRKAARMLDIARTTLDRKLNNYAQEEM